MVFLWENNFQLTFEKLNEKPYAFHWIPEVLCLIVFGMLITSIAYSSNDTSPREKAKIKHIFLLTFFTIGLFLLCVNLFVLGNPEPKAFVGFFWGSLPLLGYSIEMRTISHAK